MSGSLVDLGEQEIFVHQFRAVTRNLDTGEVDPQFVCHAHLGPLGARSDLDGTGPRPAPGKSMVGGQGAPETILPDGFALRFKADQPLAVSGMALNNNPNGQMQEVVYDIEIKYWIEADARRLGVQTLDIAWMRVTPKHDMPTHGGEDQQGHTGMHWLVPPGNHVYTTKLSTRPLFRRRAETARVHYIAIHLHPFGRWLELFDLTSGETVWRGEAATDSDRRFIVSIDHFSSREGLLIQRDHEYELRAGYYNPLEQPIDAMATMRLFYRPDSVIGTG
jgi:hypothetical protein